MAGVEHEEASGELLRPDLTCQVIGSACHVWKVTVLDTCYWGTLLQELCLIHFQKQQSCVYIYDCIIEIIQKLVL
jgi:hypothetical protein